MINHYLLGLTVEEEDRVLTTTMRPGSYHDMGIHGPCLVGVVRWPNPTIHRFVNLWPPLANDFTTNFLSPERRYDELCKRFGTSRINTVIRNRVLANRVRRMLQDAVELTLAGASV